MNYHGLSDTQLNILKHILACFYEHITKVCLFGSRANGLYKPNSDIDLVLYGDLSAEDEDRLYTLLNDSTLCLNVDVIVYHLITHPPLKQHVDETNQLLFTKQDLLPLR
jgi:predicted nucleotidyltransferase